MNVLHITLNRKWFEMIRDGIKKEEYREIKPYWVQRLLMDTWPGIGNELNKVVETGIPEMQDTVLDVMQKPFDIVSANNGYQKDCPNIQWKHEGIRIGEGREDWGATPGKQYFILSIGEIIKK